MDCFIINLGRFKDDDYTIGAFSIMNSLREEGLNVQYFSNLKDSIIKRSLMKLRKHTISYQVSS